MAEAKGFGQVGGRARSAPGTRFRPAGPPTRQRFRVADLPLKGGGKSHAKIFESRGPWGRGQGEGVSPWLQ
jgi:hypothetical protein